MTLVAGTSLGPYRIVGPIGAGGMGEVYHAQDPRLGRDVAVKILPAAFSADPDRLHRFEQEARAAGALNHPNILAVHDVGTQDATPYVVSELLLGQTLGARLAGGALPLRKSLDYAIQIANGLAAAHAKGIVHRDLKPENLFVTHDGRVKILDFGLAKLKEPAPEPAASQGATISTPPQTTPGAILGTVGYMSPEQTNGLPADHRSDIFGFGAILYEMLLGRRAFRGDSAAETMFAILKTDPLETPDPQRVLPPALEKILRRCLEKSPEERFQSARDLAFHLEAISGWSDSTAAPGRAPGSFKTALWTALGLVAGGLIVGLGLRSWPGAAPVSVTRFAISPPVHVVLGNAISLSPDGRTLVYEGGDDVARGLYRRALDSLESAPIRGTEGGIRPFFSPDGGSLGFSVGRSLKRIPLDGGVPATVCEATSGLHGGTWLSDDTIVFASIGEGLMRVPASGGRPRQLTAPDPARGEVEHRSPIALPGGRSVLFTIHKGARDTQRVDALDLQTGRRSELIAGNDAWPVPTGHVAFQRAGSLWAAPFDSARLALGGAPTAVVEHIAIGDDWSPIVAVSRNGSLAYVTGAPDPYPPRDLVWVDRQGREQPIDAPARAWWWPRLSPDGKRLGFHIMDPANMDAWIYELERGPLLRMTYHALQDGYPLWSPDGKRIAFWSRQHGGNANLYLRPATLKGTEQRLTTSPNHQLPFSWAEGGKLLVYQEASPDTGLDIGVVPVEGDGKPRLLIHSRADEGAPAISPDGHWIAYHANLSGTNEVYVQPFPGLDGRWQVSTQGGLSPMWGPDGRELFYRSARALMAVPVLTSGGSFKHGNARLLFEGPHVPEEGGTYGSPNYAVAPDARRFLMMKETGARGPGGGGRHIVVIVNWPEELKRLVPK